jgi:hypothetical protein
MTINSDYGPEGHQNNSRFRPHVVYHSILQQPSCNKEKDLLLFKFLFMIKINDRLCQKAF